METIAALTTNQPGFPYVNASRLPDGRVRLIVREQVGKLATIELSDVEWRAFLSQGLASEQGDGAVIR
ncbi:hypothetical protein [Bradyrhizobium sp. Ec3.3]|uniref:hypothetical protein n=1 Tax=Bradyrhizobium sp. Ec3.3 TaxID=189753 RepID=UPI0004203869|nr:hypothetical protein [Bradyrhizobium sp. Ec3.3]